MHAGNATVVVGKLPITRVPMARPTYQAGMPAPSAGPTVTTGSVDGLCMPEHAGLAPLLGSVSLFRVPRTGDIHTPPIWHSVVCQMYP